MEYYLFKEISGKIKEHKSLLIRLAEKLAYLDVMISFATAAIENGYVRPEISNGFDMKIIEGRHPVVEKLIGRGDFVSNDTVLSEKEKFVKKFNIVKGKIEGRYGYYIRLVKGDISLKEGEKLVEFLKNLNYKVEIRLTSHQELFIANLKRADVYALENLSSKYSKKRFFSSLSCIGNTICNPGILDTPPILEMILNYFKNKQRLASYLPKIQLSGCPNSCAAHQIAELGFQGKRKKDGAYFNVFVGGRFKTDDTITLNSSVGELKAETIPLFLEEMAKILKERKITYEDYSKQNEFIELVKK